MSGVKGDIPITYSDFTNYRCLRYLTCDTPIGCNNTNRVWRVTPPPAYGDFTELRCVRIIIRNAPLDYNTGNGL